MEVVATIHQEEDGSYWAEIEQLPGCLASGATLDELLEALTEAASLYLSKPEEPPVALPRFSVTTRVPEPA